MDPELAKILADAGAVVALILLGFPVVILLTVVFRLFAKLVSGPLEGLVASIDTTVQRIEAYDSASRERDSSLFAAFQKIIPQIERTANLAEKILGLTDRGVGIFNSDGMLIASNQKFADQVGAQTPPWLNRPTFDTARVLDIVGQPLEFDRWPVGMALATCTNCVGPVQIYSFETGEHRAFLAKAYPFMAKEDECYVTLLLQEIGIAP